ncbi:DUF3182 family protein [Benzoatithermus flavus]|uniref:DUF3182 family protein n=1 Tax=Benzoatithermus flavus TaxID=3108223 RepID=A0ABU8XML2_9PROT
MQQREAVMAHGPATIPAPSGIVVVHAPEELGFTDAHEKVTRHRLARRLAALKGYDFAGDHDPTRPYAGPVYVVPSDTITDIGTAEALGIRTEHDLFGGVVPYPFAATKVITHPLVEPDAAAPAGWSHAFGQRTKDIVLEGFSVFTPADARRAGARLLERGLVRLKRVRAAGGTGQAVATTLAELEEVLEALDEAELVTHGLVLEEDLAEVTTLSIGEVRVAELVVSYYGTQRTTTDNSGAVVYGGSDLVVIRGGLDGLLRLDLPDPLRLAVAQAHTYDEAATASFPNAILSRRNYDVAQGLDARGRWRSGVLEQSWRIGGASGAEIAALEAFRADPSLEVVRTATVEVYGESAEFPSHATLSFRGVDERVGLVTKYTLVEPHDHTR